MITLLGSLLGFISSSFPDLLRIFRERNDRHHELQILDKQMEMMRQGHYFRLEEINANAGADELPVLHRAMKKSGVRWVDALAGSVRPIITYAFFILYGLVKIAQYEVMCSIMNNSNWADALLAIWQLEDQALFATVISFWFGQRMLIKAQGRRI